MLQKPFLKNFKNVTEPSFRKRNYLKINALRGGGVLADGRPKRQGGTLKFFYFDFLDGCDADFTLDAKS